MTQQSTGMAVSLLQPKTVNAAFPIEPSAATLRAAASGHGRTGSARRKTEAGPGISGLVAAAARVVTASIREKQLRWLAESHGDAVARPFALFRTASSTLHLCIACLPFTIPLWCCLVALLSFLTERPLPPIVPRSPSAQLPMRPS